MFVAPAAGRSGFGYPSGSGNGNGNGSGAAYANALGPAYTSGEAHHLDEEALDVSTVL